MDLTTRLLLVWLASITLYSDALCEKNDSKWKVVSGIRFGKVETFLKTEHYAYSMVPDQFVEGNILFSDGSSLKTTDGESIHLIVGEPRATGYVEGTASFAKLNWIHGIYQLNHTHLLVLDSRNHCLRLVHRETNHTAPFVGKCGESGYRDGLDPLFCEPWAINLLSEDPPVVIVSDRGNNALRVVNILHRNVSTLPLASQLNSPQYAMLDKSRNTLFVSNPTRLMKISMVDYSVEDIAGKSTVGHIDGWLEDVTFRNLDGIVKLSENVLVIADTGQSKLKVLDLQQQFVRSICPGKPYEDSDGDLRICKIDRPSSLLMVDGFLYISGYKVIKRVKVEALASSCSTPIHKSEDGACPADVVITADAKTKTTPYTFISSGTRHSLQLPVGIHKYTLDGDGVVCSLNVTVEESHLQWRLGFKADYDIPCGELTSAVKIMIVSLANHRYKDIKYLCGGGCDEPKDAIASVSCYKDTVTVIWPTDVMYKEAQMSVPAFLTSAVSDKLKGNVNVLDLVLYTRMPPVVYPRLNKSGLPVDLVLLAECSNGRRYNSVTKTCEGFY